MRVFILEDDAERMRLFREVLVRAHVDHAADVAKATAVFAPPYDLLLLDHDLGDKAFVDSADANTGAAFARWLTEVPERLAEIDTIIVHSYNMAGAGKMVATLREVVSPMEAVTWEPFGNTLLEALRSWLDADKAVQ